VVEGKLFLQFLQGAVSPLLLRGYISEFGISSEVLVGEEFWKWMKVFLPRCPLHDLSKNSRYVIN